MKKSKIASIFGGVMALTMALTGCGNTSTNSTSTASSNADSAAGSTANSAAESSAPTTSGEKKIGVIQYAPHPSLDNCYKGIEEGLNASSLAGTFTIDLQNAQGSTETADQIAKNMVANKYDMIFAIATPAAVSAYSAAKDSNIPVIFCSVSDPVAAGLTESMDKGLETCVGSSDVLNFDKQVELIKTVQPDVKKIGVLYTNTEANSVSQLKTFKEVCSNNGIEVVDQSVSGAADIPQAAADLASKVDCINNFTDNNVVNNLSVLLEKANAAKVPVYGSEVEQVKNGCIASMSIDYVELGKATADMGVEVLNGKKCSDMGVKVFSECTPVFNTEVMDSFGITIPDAYKDAEKVTTNKADDTSAAA